MSRIGARRINTEWDTRTIRIDSRGLRMAEVISNAQAVFIFYANEKADEEEENFDEQARKDLDDLRKLVKQGELINFRDAIKHEKVSFCWDIEANRKA